MDSTTFKDYNFYSAQDVEGLIKQIPDILPYIDSVPEDEEPVSRSRNLTKKELAKLTPEAKILNILSNKKAKDIKDYLLEKFDRILVDTLDQDNNNCLFQRILWGMGGDDEEEEEGEDVEDEPEDDLTLGLV